MKKLTVILLFALLAVSYMSYAQDPPKYSYQLGRVTQYEVSVTEYEGDKDAEAFVIFEKGRNYYSPDDVSGGFLLYMEKELKIKVLKQAGIKYGEIEIPFYVSKRGREELYKIEGTTYNYQNQQLEKFTISPQNIFEEKITDNWYVKKIAMPNVREGSVIELSYTIISPYYTNINEWRFQRKIPVLYSQVVLKTIPFFEYAYILKGASKFDDTLITDGMTMTYAGIQFKEKVNTFSMQNIPAFKDEEFITSENDHMVSLNFQLSKVYSLNGTSQAIMSTWPELCNDFLKSASFGKYIKAAEKEGKKIILSLNIDNLSPLEKIKVIERYVKQNYNWNGISSKYTSGKISGFLKQKTGNSADINLFLTGLLNAAGINAAPVVLSTRAHGTVYLKYPFSNFLNYTIVQASLADTTYLLDATEPMMYFSQLPERCTSIKGLVVKPKSEEWIDIYQSDIAQTDKTFVIKIDEEQNQLLADVKINAFAYDAYAYRSLYSGDGNNLKKYFQIIEVDITGEIDIQNYNEIDKPFEFSFHTTQPLQQADDRLFISPFINQSVTKNRFNKEKRTLSIDLVNLHAATYESVIEIPEGYKVESLPEKMVVDNKVILIEYNAVQTDGKIVVSAGYSFKKIIYPATDYDLLKSACSDMVKQFNELIVLVKE